MLNKIPLSRLLLYLAIAGALPFLAWSAYFVSSYRTYSSLSERIDRLRFSALLQEQRQATNRSVVAHYRDADHFYIDKQLETLSFLEAEKSALKELLEKKGSLYNDI